MKRSFYDSIKEFGETTIKEIEKHEIMEKGYDWDDRVVTCADSSKYRMAPTSELGKNIIPVKQYKKQREYFKKSF